MMCNCDKKLLEKTKEIVKKYKIPFYCPECGCLKFNYKAIRDIVFIFPFPQKEKLGFIYLPDTIRGNHPMEYGVILSAGKGYFNKKGKFIPVKVVPGDVVVYDRNIPWSVDLKNDEGNYYKVKYAGYQDIKAIIKDWGEEFCQVQNLL